MFFFLSLPKYFLFPNGKSEEKNGLKPKDREVLVSTCGPVPLNAEKPVISSFDFFFLFIPSIFHFFVFFLVICFNMFVCLFLLLLCFSFYFVCSLNQSETSCFVLFFFFWVCLFVSINVLFK